ncbi:hypothetical protein CK203_057024 [Vitis vinifera]|uniref:Uncharacterized protein n=1 Tax=Vitis vinifera TaxID=29760 RepID=A0A438DPQ9_VITVI|nr:hypothetical protein CK203_114395 [Vitis vinifera]RVW68927.1 hypothetical protein CK203_057024 [Vitis vinifera]
MIEIMEVDNLQAYIDSDAIEANSTVCLSTYTDLDACGTSLGDAIPEGSFSYIVLVSLSMAQAISTSCSSTDVMLVAITNMVIKNKEVKKLEWSKGLFCFNSPIGEQVVELASTIKYRDLSSKSFIVEWYFSLP